MSCDLKTLLQQACGNDFLQLANSDPKLARAVILQLLCESATGTLNSGSVFQSPLQTIAAEDYFVQVPHGLGRKPYFLRAVTVAMADDGNLNIKAGTEIDIWSWDWPQTGPWQYSRWAIESDATYVYAAHACWACDPTSPPQLMLNGDRNPSSDITQYKLKFYAF